MKDSPAGDRPESIDSPFQFRALLVSTLYISVVASCARDSHQVLVSPAT